jgi:hypothetical protein
LINRSGPLFTIIVFIKQTESSLGEEASLVGHGVYLPLPCEREELTTLRTFMARFKVGAYVHVDT